MRKAVVIILLFFTFKCFASAPLADSSLTGWDTTIVRLANSASDAAYMTTDEKKVIFYINLSRMQPRLFVKTILKKYLNDNPDMASDPYVISLIKDLKNNKPLHPLQPKEGLHDCAAKWAYQSGLTGEIGHRNFEKRMSKFIKESMAAGENCDYGNKDPLDIVLDLLIDKGVEDLGHRKNILAPCFNYIGVGIKPHKGYRWDCVMDFEG